MEDERLEGINEGGELRVERVDEGKWVDSGVSNLSITDSRQRGEEGGGEREGTQLIIFRFL